MRPDKAAGTVTQGSHVRPKVSFPARKEQHAVTPEAPCDTPAANLDKVELRTHGPMQQSTHKGVADPSLRSLRVSPILPLCMIAKKRLTLAAST